MTANGSFLSVPSVAALTGLTPQHCSSSQPGALSSQDAPATSSTPPDDGDEDDEMDSQTSSCSGSDERTSETMDSASDSRSASFASQDSDDSSNSAGSSAMRSYSGSFASDPYDYHRAQDTNVKAVEVERERGLDPPADDDFSMALKRRLRALISCTRHDEEESEDIPEPQHPPGLVAESTSVAQYAHIPRLIDTKSTTDRPPPAGATAYPVPELKLESRSRALLLTADSISARQQNRDPSQAHILSQNLSTDFPGQLATSNQHCHAQEVHSPFRAVPLKRSRSNNDALTGSILAKRAKMDAPTHSDQYVCISRTCSHISLFATTYSTQQQYDEKENIHPMQGAAQPLQNALVRSRSRLALSTSLRRSTSSKALVAKQASAADVPFVDIPASLRKAGSLRSDVRTSTAS